MIVALLAATILMADAAPAATPTAASAAKVSTTATAQKTADSNKLVCKSEPVLGSRMPVKKCRTVGDAAAEKLEAQQALERMQGDNTISSK